MTTLAFASSSAPAIARPIPRDPPVTTATLRARSIVWGMPDMTTRIIESVPDCKATKHSMSFVAIIGSGALGGAVAHALALRDRIREIRLIDAEERIAQGKALDIRQSSPIDQFSSVTIGSGAIAAAAGAAAIVLADPASGAGEFSGEAGLTLLRQLAAIESNAPIVCAGGSQRELIVRGVSELHIAEARLIGSAPVALESALRALAALPIDSSPVPIALN